MFFIIIFTHNNVNSELNGSSKLKSWMLLVLTVTLKEVDCVRFTPSCLHPLMSAPPHVCSPCTVCTWGAEFLLNLTYCFPVFFVVAEIRTFNITEIDHSFFKCFVSIRHKQTNHSDALRLQALTQKWEFCKLLLKTKAITNVHV